MDIHCPLKKVETRCLGGVIASILASRNRHQRSRHSNRILICFSRRSDIRYGFEKYFKLYCVLHSFSNQNWFALSTNTVLATKFPTDFNSTLHCFPIKLFKTFVALSHFFSTCATRWKKVKIHKYLWIWLLLVCIKGKLVLPLDKTSYDSQETRPKFIDSTSQNFYFHFQYKLFCINAVHLYDVPSIMAFMFFMYFFMVFMYLNVFWMCNASWKKLCLSYTVLKSCQKNKEELNWSLLEIS